MPRLLKILTMIAVAFFLMPSTFSTTAVGVEQRLAPEGEVVLLGAGSKTDGRGMAFALSHSLTAELSIDDIPLSYAPPVGNGMDFNIN